MKSVFFILMIFVTDVCSVAADSLWQKRSPEHASLFADSKARGVGDLLTVVVSQDTNVNSLESRGMGKSSSASAAFSFDGEAGGGFGAQESNAALDINGQSGRKFDGKSTFRSNQAFTDRITVTVMDILPNGNMVISGQRTLRVAGDDQTLMLTGMVRAIDVGPDNTISSRHISELDLKYESVGPSKRFTRQGWLGRATNRIWPF